MSMELDKTEEKIVYATFKILQKEGVEKATTKKIAAEAGVNEVTIFRKFENKNNLIEISKNYYMDVLIKKLEEIFDYDEDDTIEDYLQSNFEGFLHLPEEDLSIIKIALEEVRDVSGRKLLVANITDVVIAKLKSFFKLQMEKGEIRQTNPTVLAILCLSMTFHSVVLWKVYNKEPDMESKQFGYDFLDVLFNGIKE